MEKTEKCPTCKRQMYKDFPHICEPAFDCREGGTSNDWDTVHSSNPEDAAQSYVQDKYDDLEHPESGFTVEVKPAGVGGPVTVFEVDVTWDPSFSLSEKKTYVCVADLERESND